MKIQFHTRGLKDNQWLRQRWQRSLERLAVRIPISDAAVVMEHEPHGGPAFRAFALLAVPGPDIHAEAHDYTIDAAWLKVTTALFEQIEQRKNQQVLRAKRNDHLRSQNHRRIAGTLPSIDRMGNDVVNNNTNSGRGGRNPQHRTRS